MKCIIGIILWLIGLSSIICAVVWQQALCYQMFGVVFKTVFIPHWSALFYLGIVPLGVGRAMVQMG